MHLLGKAARIAASAVSAGAAHLRRAHRTVTSAAGPSDITVNAVRVHTPGGPEQFVFEPIQLRPPRRGEALVRHTAVGVNFIDTYHRSGLYPLSLPGIVGSEGVGVVEAVGPDVSSVAVGDRVAYAAGLPGSYCEARNYPAARLVRVPAGVSDELAAAALLKGMTTQYLLRRTYRVQPGDTVLVHAAAGGVGTLLCQWAKHLGATVIGTVGSAAKEPVARAAGADHVLQTDQPDLARRVRELSGGRGVPVVYDGVGRSTFTVSLDCLRPLGLLVSYGNASGPVERFDLLTLANKGSLFVTRPTLATYTAERAELERTAGEVWDMLMRNALRVEIGGRYALRDAAQADRDLEARRTTGSLLLLP